MVTGIEADNIAREIGDRLRVRLFGPDRDEGLTTPELVSGALRDELGPRIARLADDLAGAWRSNRVDRRPELDEIIREALRP